jgi:hypothetical protein
MQESGDEPFTFQTLIRDFYLTQACAPHTIFNGLLSDLGTKVEIKSVIITHICDIVKRLMAPPGSLADQTYNIVQVLDHELEDLRQTGLTRIVDSQQSTDAIARGCETHLTACAIHPEIDIHGTSGMWVLSLFQDQPRYRDSVISDHEEGPESIYALVQLLRQCLSSAEYAFVRTFETFGRWAVTMTVDHLRQYEILPRRRNQVSNRGHQ